MLILYCRWVSNYSSNIYIYIYIYIYIHIYTYIYIYISIFNKWLSRTWKTPWPISCCWSLFIPLVSAWCPLKGHNYLNKPKYVWLFSRHQALKGYTPWKHQKIYCFFVFRGYRKRPVTWYGFKVGKKRIVLHYVKEVFLVHIFSHSDWIRRDTGYLSVLSPNAGKYGPEKLRLWMLFTQFYYDHQWHKIHLNFGKARQIVIYLT